MNLFYTVPELVNPPFIRLEGQEAIHAVKVLRYRTDDPIHITDGCGKLYEATVTDTGKKHLSAKIKREIEEVRQQPYISLLVGLIKKKDRLEFAVEKCVELGADRIQIFIGDHSEKQNVRTDRLMAAALSAMKQSLRTYLPAVDLFKSLEDAIRASGDGVLIMADEASKNPGVIQTNPDPASEHLVLIVGPEGGFSERERKTLMKEDAKPWSLGPKRLRTETAAIAIVNCFRAVKG